MTERSERTLLPAVFLSTFLIRLGYGLALGVYTFYLGNTVETAGLTAAASPAIEASTVLFAGIAADRFGRLPILRVGLLFGSVLLFAMAFTRDPLYQTLISGAFGLSSASILAASLAVTGDVSARNERGFEMGRFDSFNLAGWIWGYALGLILVSVLNGKAHPGNLSVVFDIGSGVVLVALVALMALSRGLKETHIQRAFDRAEIKDALLRTDVLLVVLPWMPIYMLLGALFAFLGEAGSTLNIPSWELGGGILIAGSLLLFTQPFYGRLSDRLGRTRIMLVGVAGFLGVLLFGSLVAIFGISGLRALLIAGIGLSAIPALAFGPSSLAALTDSSRQSRRGTTMSFYSLSIATGMAVGLAVSAEFYTFWNTWGVVYFFALVAALLALFTALRIRRLHELRLQETPPLNNHATAGPPK